MFDGIISQIGHRSCKIFDDVSKWYEECNVKTLQTITLPYRNFMPALWRAVYRAGESSTTNLHRSTDFVSHLHPIANRHVETLRYSPGNVTAMRVA